jgi:hypothetical protein
MREYERETVRERTRERERDYEAPFQPEGNKAHAPTKADTALAGCLLLNCQFIVMLMTRLVMMRLVMRLLRPLPLRSPPPTCYKLPGEWCFPVYASVCQCMPVYASGVSQCMPVYASVCQCMPVYASLCLLCSRSLSLSPVPQGH